MLAPRLLTALALAAALAPAQDNKDDKKPTADETATRLFTAWEKREYRIGREGVAKASYKIVARVWNAGGAALGGDGSYRFDGKKSTLTWDNPQLGAILDRQGWSARDQENRLRADNWVSEFQNCRLTSRRDGKRTVIDIEPASATGAKAFVFDETGTMVGMKVSVPGQGPLEFTFHYKKRGEKLLNTGWEFRMGPYSEKTVLTFAESDGLPLLSKAIVEGSMAGKLVRKVTLEFKDWKLNDDVT